MRHDEEDDDPKKPHPVERRRKGDNDLEVGERGWYGVRPDADDREHHHVSC